MPVSEPVTSPMTTARNALLARMHDEFGGDGFTVVADKLHKSLGRDGTTRIGVSPIQETPLSSNRLVVGYAMLVQFYGKWTDKIDPALSIDPTAVETYSERFKRSLKGHDPNTDTVWYFLLTDLTYPDDPTGNITRFEAKVTATGSNSSLIETTG